MFPLSKINKFFLSTCFFKKNYDLHRHCPTPLYFHIAAVHTSSAELTTELHYDALRKA